MSETITLGKSRKDGSWKVLVQPERPFGEHLAAYRKIATTHPVSDEFTRVIIGKIHHSSPALTLVSTEEKATKDKTDAASVKTATDIVKSSDKRQADLEKKKAKEMADEHKELIDAKNAMIENIRKTSGQK